jgi:DNA-binding PadR family transcriptional regulator
MRDPVAREFLLAFWKIHILHHAGEHGVYGQWMLEELRRHGYALSPGTLYPMLARMAGRGWLRATEPSRSKGLRLYRLTPRGHDVLTRLRESLDELYREVNEDHAEGEARPRTTRSPAAGPAARRVRPPTRR